MSMMWNTESVCLSVVLSQEGFDLADALDSDDVDKSRKNKSTKNILGLSEWGHMISHFMMISLCPSPQQRRLHQNQRCQQGAPEQAQVTNPRL